MVRIGCGAGFGGDRLEPAVRLLEDGDLDYLVLECLAERTIGLGQKRRMHDPSSRLRSAAGAAHAPAAAPAEGEGHADVTNMGSANPIAAGQKIVRVGRGTGPRNQRGGGDRRRRSRCSRSGRALDGGRQADLQLRACSIGERLSWVRCHCAGPGFRCRRGDHRPGRRSRRWSSLRLFITSAGISATPTGSGRPR